MSDWQHPFDADGVLRCHWEELQDVRLVVEGGGGDGLASTRADTDVHAAAVASANDAVVANGTARGSSGRVLRRRPTHAAATGPPPLPKTASPSQVPTEVPTEEPTEVPMDAEVVVTDGVWADVAQQLRAKKQQLQRNLGARVTTPGATRPRPGVRRAALGPLLARLAAEDQ